MTYSFFWRGSENELKDFIKHLNSLHPFLKFKASYDFNKKTVEFLDTVISINSNGFIKTDLYEKPGRVCNYLLTSSSHPSHITENIPYSLALRLKRICSEIVDFLTRLDDLKTTLLSRGYRLNFITKAFEKVKLIDRKTALKQVEKKIVKRNILSLPYDPRLPNISNILYRFWNVMTKNPRLKRIFSQAPMICWTRPKNIREFLVKANLPKAVINRQSVRQKLGFKHCNRNCNLCKNSPRFSKSVISSTTNEIFPILSNLDCLSTNVIYCITCTKGSGLCKFKPQYIGKTKRRICDRFNEHKQSIKPDSTKTVGIHFSSTCHGPNNFEMVPIEHVNSKDPWILLSREKYYIRKFDPVLNVRM